MFGTALFLLCCSSFNTAAFGFDLGLDLSEFDSSAVNLSSQYLLVGQTLNVTCTLTPKYTGNYSSKDIYFRHTRKTCYPPENATWIDDETAMLSIPVTIESAAYDCSVNDTGCRGLNTLGSSDKVVVEYQPKPVVNFSCETLNWEEFSCHWDYPVSYVNQSNIYVSFCFRRITMKMGPKYCYNKTGKSFKKQTVPYTIYLIDIRVINSKVQVAAELQNFMINSSSIVRPDPVTSFTVAPSPRCFSFKWTSSSSFQYVSRISLQNSSHSSEHLEIIADDLINKTFKKCDFEANSRYNFCVQLYPSNGYSGFWSSPVCKTGTTPITAPSGSPQITPGSYDYPVDSCHRCDRRNVTLFWKRLELSKQNGALDGYHITVNGESKIASRDSFSTLVTLPCSKEYVVSISAFNSIGSSPLPSQWSLEPFTRQLKVPDFIQKSFLANFTDDKVSVSWDPETESFANSHKMFVYWCKGTSSNHKCEGEVSWSEVQNMQQKMALPIESLEASMYLYGISLQDKSSNASSGIVWTSCLLQNNAKVIMPDYFNLEVSVGEIVVTWFTQDCSYKRNYKIVGHELKWCLSEQCKETFVAYPQRSYTLSDVLPGHTYNVTMKTVTQNKESAFLPWKSATPRAEDEPTNYVFVFIIVVLIIIVGILVGIFYGVNRWRGTVVLKWFGENSFDDLMKLPVYMEDIAKAVSKNNLSMQNDSIRNCNNGVSVSSVESSPVSQQSLNPSPLSSSGQSSSSVEQNDERSGARLLPKVKLKKKKKKPQDVLPVNGVPLTELKRPSGESSTQTGTCSGIDSNTSQITDFNDSVPKYSKVADIDPNLKEISDSKPIVSMNGIMSLSESKEDFQKMVAFASPLSTGVRGFNRENYLNHNRRNFNNFKSCNKNSSIFGEESQAKDNSAILKFEIPQTITQNVEPLLHKIPSHEDHSDRFSNNELNTPVLSISSSDTIHQHQQRDSHCNATEASGTTACGTEHPEYVQQRAAVCEMRINNDNVPQNSLPTTYSDFSQDSRTSNSNDKSIRTAPSSTTENDTKQAIDVNASVNIPSLNLEHLKKHSQAAEGDRMSCKNNNDCAIEQPIANIESTRQMTNNVPEIVTPPTHNGTDDDNFMISVDDKEHVRTCTNDSDHMTEAPASSANTEDVWVPPNCDDYVGLPSNDTKHEGGVESSDSDNVLFDNGMEHNVGRGPGNHSESLEGIPPNNEERISINEIATEHADGIPFNETGHGNISSGNESENLDELSGDSTAHAAFPSHDSENMRISPRNDASVTITLDTSSNEAVNVSPSMSIVV